MWAAQPKGRAEPLCPGFRHTSLQRQGVQRATHLALQGLVNDLMLLNPGLAAEGFRDHGRGIMIAIAGQVADGHLRIRDTALDQPLDVSGVHWHRKRSPFRPTLSYEAPCRTARLYQNR